MKNYSVAVLLFLISSAVSAQDMQMKMPEPKPVEIYSGLGSWHHATSTKNSEAQKFFDQGLRMTYGFNHEEAGRSFKRAAELDPDNPNYPIAVMEARIRAGHIDEALHYARTILDSAARNVA